MLEEYSWTEEDEDEIQTSEMNGETKNDEVNDAGLMLADMRDEHYLLCRLTVYGFSLTEKRRGARRLVPYPMLSVL